MKISALKVLTLRPYGEALATPAVRVWLTFAWIIILLMASIEGIVWGFVGASIVPQAAAWLRPITGLFMFALMFSVIWVVDASLIMSERPTRGPKHPAASRPLIASGTGSWVFGLAVRVMIVAISLYVTAPFLAKLIRADDIESYHQRLVEHYYAQREAAFEVMVDARARAAESSYQASLQSLEIEIERLTRSLTDAHERRARIEAEYAPEIEVLRAEVAAAQARLGDEIHGRGDRPAGYGPEARRWEARANDLVATLAAKQSEIDGRSGEVARTIDQLEEALRARTDELQQTRREHQERLEAIRTQVAAEQPDDLPPRLTFAARSKALQALRESPDEAGVPHFETVDGFAQAALAILFFSLIALKLFEPASVRAYFNEALQVRYRQYLDGALARIPGFEPPETPSHRLSPRDLAHLWQHYEKDPEGYFAERAARLSTAEGFMERQAEHLFVQTRLDRRRENLEEELAMARQRRALELVALEQEQGLRISELRNQLADETEAKKDHHRRALDQDLLQAREAWLAYRAREEAELRERCAALEHERQQAQRELGLREKELDARHQQRQTELDQAALDQQLRVALQQAEKSTERLRVERAGRLTRLHQEVARLRKLEAEQRQQTQRLNEERQRQLNGIAALNEQIETSERRVKATRHREDELRRRLDSFSDPSVESAPPAGTGWLSAFGRSPRTAVAQDTERALKAQKKRVRETEARLQNLREERRALELRRIANKDQLLLFKDHLSDTEARIRFYEDAIAALLTQDLSSNEEPGKTDA